MTSISVPRRWLPSLKPAVLAAGAVVFTCLSGSAAWAVDFRLCNATSSRVGIAVGYKDGETWVTEGWWNVGASSCETLLKGPLVARFYYIYAMDYDNGGEWGGSAFMCTREKEFTIRGVDNCLARGFARTGFFEIDTGEQRSWTVQLTEGSATKPGDAASGNVTLGRSAVASGAPKVGTGSR
jgi:uncharacterized membrane protein